MVGMRFNTIGVSDGISMGTDGMSFSLQSRDLIADSIETVMSAPVVRRQHLHSGLRQEHAGLPDGDGPAESSVADGLWRHDPGRLHSTAHRSWTSFPRFKATANSSRARSSTRKRQTIVRQACPGAGACGGMYTANTMASAIEALGMSLPYSSSTPGRRSAEAATSVCAPARPSASCLNSISSRATS